MQKKILYYQQMNYLYFYLFQNERGKERTMNFTYNSYSYLPYNFLELIIYDYFYKQGKNYIFKTWNLTQQFFSSFSSQLIILKQQENKITLEISSSISLLSHFEINKNTNNSIVSKKCENKFQQNNILLAYPALSLDTIRQDKKLQILEKKEFKLIKFLIREILFNSINQIFLVSLDDSLLHHTVLKLCLNSYVQKEFNPKIDPMLSPSCVSEEILKHFPKTRIVAGTYDPLHDESLRLLLKLVQQKKDVKLIEYQSMPHGFLSFDIINGMKEAKQTVIDAQNCLLEMLN